METRIIETTESSEQVLETLSQHLPYSLPTLRRLQFMKIGGSKTENSHVLSTFGDKASGKDFLVAVVDLSRCPETEIWIYSSFENPHNPGDEAVCEQQILAFFARVREIERAYHGQRETPGIVLVASLHEKILKLLERRSMVKTKTGEHFKFIFRKENLPLGSQLPDGLFWSSVRESDLPLVLSRTAIPYKASSMKLLPSVAIESNLGVPIAWAFLGIDGSLKTLHCEEEYRGRGFAKAVAIRLFHEKTEKFAHDGFYHADVAVENLQSQGVCKSLKGTSEWRNYFVWVELS